MASYAGGSRYYKARTAPRYAQQGGGDVERGLQVGQTIGKLLGGLGDAIKEARKNALANKLMSEEAIGEQPGAGVTQSLGKLGDGDGSGDGGATQPLDLGPTPPDQTFTNPSSGNVEPLQQPSGASDQDLARAMAAAQLQGSSAAPSVGGTGQGVSDADLQRAMAGNQLPSLATQPTRAPAGGDFTLNPSDYSAGGTAFGDKGTDAGSVGGLIHTGGTQELDLQKEILAMRLSKGEAAAKVAAAQAKAADDAAKAAGTGQYAVEAAKRRADLQKVQLEIEEKKAGKADKNAPLTNVGEEPVTDVGKLNTFIDNTHGEGAASALVNYASANDLSKQTGDLAIPIGALNADGTPKKTITMPLLAAQRYIKQKNAMLLAQGLPALRVPGEDLMLGATRDNPYPTKNNLDVQSRAPGTWVTLPDGSLAQVPQRKR